LFDINQPARDGDKVLRPHMGMQGGPTSGGNILLQIRPLRQLADAVHDLSAGIAAAAPDRIAARVVGRAFACAT
jgi:hypothetical protein